MARDIKDRSWNESEEFDFQSDDEINLFGESDHVMYLRYGYGYIKHSDANPEEVQDKEQD